MEEAEIAKDRVRLLMDRYGILFRQLLERELPAFRWAAVFRSLRTMELSGEIVSGCFFDDLPGLQFVSQRMLLVLQGSLPEDHVYWLHAQDPASVCGLDIEALKSMAPKRLSGTHLVYMGSRLALVSERKGKSLQVLLPVDHHRIDDCLDLFDHLLNRRVDARSSITVETINGQPASDSRFIEVLRRRFDISVEAPKIIVYRLRVSK